MPQNCNSDKIVGRNPELEQLYSSLSDAINGRTTNFLISGEAGIGKTKLIEEVERTAKRLDVLVLRTECLAGYGFANQPFMDILRMIKPILHSFTYDQNEIADVSKFERNIDETSDIRTTDDPLAHRPEGLLILFLNLIRLICRKKPLILIVEDLHWADSSSIQLLFNISRNIKKERLMMIVTYRPEELVGGEGIENPLSEIMNEMRKEENVKHLELVGLSPRATSELLTNYFKNSIYDRVAERIVKESAGNPLFALETARLLMEATPETSGYMDSVDGYAIPTAVREAINRRLRGVDEESRNCLECASIIGSHIDLDILAELLGKNKLKVIDILDRLCRERSLLIERDNVFQFSHDKIRQAILEGMTVNRRIELNRVVGNILERKRMDESTVARLSYHYLIAMEREKITKYSYHAGDYCLRRSAAIEAIVYFDRALNNFYGEDHLKEAIIEKKGDAFMESGNFDEAIKCYSYLIDNGDCLPKARLLRKSSELYVPTRLGKGKADIALKMLNDAEKEEIDDLFEKGEIASDRATLELWMGNPKEALRYCSMAEELFHQSGTTLRLTLEMVEHSTVLVSIGDICGCLDKLNEVMERIKKDTNPFIDIVSHQCMGMALLHTGSYEKAIEEEDKALDISMTLDYHYFSCWCHLFISYAMLLNGKEDQSLINAESALNYAELSGSKFQRAGCQAMKAMLLNRSGRRNEAVHLLTKSEDLMKTFDWVIKTPMHGLILLSQAELAVDVSDPASIDELYQNAIEEFRDNTWGYFYRMLAHGMAFDSMTSRGEYELASYHLNELIPLAITNRNSHVYQKARGAAISTKMD